MYTQKPVNNDPIVRMEEDGRSSMDNAWSVVVRLKNTHASGKLTFTDIEILGGTDTIITHYNLLLDRHRTDGGAANITYVPNSAGVLMLSEADWYVNDERVQTVIFDIETGEPRFVEYMEPEGGELVFTSDKETLRLFSVENIDY